MRGKFLLGLAGLLLVLLLAVPVFGQAPIGSVPLPDVVPPGTMDVYLRALRELGSFGALLWLMYQHHKERSAVLTTLLEQMVENTAALRSIEQFMRDRMQGHSRAEDQ